MRRLTAIGILALTIVVVRPGRADADITAFLGFAPTPEARFARGWAIGVNIILVGFEFEHSNTREKIATGTPPTGGAPGLSTYMFNGLVMTPTSGIQLYATAGAGVYRERVLEETETSFGTNVGGGAKLTLAGPFKLRLDYRVFNLRGNAIHKHPQRFYAGLSLAF